jgi:hypothetical protein
MNETVDQNRTFVLDEGVPVLILTRGSETEGRHDLVEATQRPGTMTPCTCTPATTSACG